MEDKIFVVSSCNAWHSLDSMCCMGVFTTMEQAVDEIVDKCFDDEEKEQARKMLESNYQTQGYETNYMIEIYRINELFVP